MLGSRKASDNWVVPVAPALPVPSSDSIDWPSTISAGDNPQVSPQAQAIPPSSPLTGADRMWDLCYSNLLLTIS